MNCDIFKLTDIFKYEFFGLSLLGVVMLVKVLLLNPPWPGKGIGTRSQNRIIKQRADMFVQYPLFMGYSSARLRKAGYEVGFIDAIVERLSFDETTNRVQKFDPDVILVESVTPSIDYDIDYMKRLKGLVGAKIVFCGPHVTHFGGKSLEEYPVLDVVIKGDFDTRIVEVVENLEDDDALSKIGGIAYRTCDGVVVDTGKAVFLDNLDDLPFPDRETIPFNSYGEAWYNRRPFINMLTTRGCPYGCTFCISPHAMEGLKWRQRSISNVISEIREVVTKHGVKEINFDDPTFTIDPKRVVAFCRALRNNKLKIIWTCNGRVDNVVRHPQMLSEMRRAGCKMIRFGIEAGNPEVLKAIRKGLTLDQMREGVHLTKKAGILALCGFMFGFPTDSRETIEDTIAIAKELRPDLIQASIAMPYPGTVLYDEAVRDGKVIAKSWKEFDMTYGPVVQTKDMTREYLEGILKRMYREFYFRPSFFVQTLFGIRRISDVSRISRNFVTMVRTMLFYDAKGSEGRANEEEIQSQPIEIQAIQAGLKREVEV